VTGDRRSDLLWIAIVVAVLSALAWLVLLPPPKATSCNGTVEVQQLAREAATARSEAYLMTSCSAE
jgi:hypothetical protein